MNYANRWDLLEAATKSGRMQEAAGVMPIAKLDGVIYPIRSLTFDYASGDYEFPLAVVEGKQVWMGDTLYDGKGATGVVYTGWADHATWSCFSWNPPKPKTVMVELPLDVVESYAAYPQDVHSFMIDACRKALAANTND